MYVSKLYDVIVCGGVEIRGLQASAIPRKKPAGDPVLEEYTFIPHFDRASVSLRDIARLSTHISFENSSGIKVKTIELIEENDKVSFSDLLSPWISEALGDMPLIQAEVGIYGAKVKFEDGTTLPQNITTGDVKKVTADSNALLAVGHNLLANNRSENLSLLLEALKKGGFILSRETKDLKDVENLARAKGLDVLLEKTSGKELFVLMKKLVKVPEKTSIVRVSNQKFDWVETMKKTLSAEIEKETSGSTRIVFVGQGDFENGRYINSNLTYVFL